MGALERFGRKLLETVEDRTGREVVPSDRLELLESAETDSRSMRKMLTTIRSYSGTASTITGAKIAISANATANGRSRRMAWRKPTMRTARLRST